MTIPCSIVRALRVVVRGIDWVTNDGRDLEFSLCAICVIWGTISVFFEGMFHWGWWSLTGPLIVLAFSTAVYWLFRGLGAAYAALRHWTETRYLECVKKDMPPS